MIHALGVPRTEVDLVFEQPLPWRAAEVFVSFDSGPAIVCRVSRCPGDVLRVEQDHLDVPVGTPVEMQWTQDERGGFVAGVVVAVPAFTGPGVYVQVDESVSGVERRLGIRIPVQVPARVITASGLTLDGCTRDLSLGGVHVVAEPGGEAAGAPAGSGIAVGGRVALSLTLPDGAVELACVVTSVDRERDAVRLRFLAADRGAVGRVETFLRAEQRRVTAPQKGGGA